MGDFFEIDFLDVESDRSGDAITLRYEVDGATQIHVVDGGYADTGESVIRHINKYYGNPVRVDHVVATHPDGDHVAGLTSVVEEFEVGALWMLRPWLYANELIDRFSRFTSTDNLAARLREAYPAIAELEKVAYDRGVPIMEPFQGARIGEFTVLAPTRTRYLDLIVESEKTPEAGAALAAVLGRAVRRAASYVRAVWGDERFSPNETSAENEMSVVQFARMCDERIVLTGDTGRTGLSEAADYAPAAGLVLPGVTRFQVPHHGSRRNASTEVFDRWLGPRLPNQPADGQESFTAIISAAKKDEDHPRKAVVRAVIHRGAKVFTTEGTSLRTSRNAPDREDWSWS